MKKLAALLFIFILFLSPFAIAEEGTTETPPSDSGSSPPPDSSSSTSSDSGSGSSDDSSSSSGSPEQTSQPSQEQPPQQQPPEQPPQFEQPQQPQPPQPREDFQTPGFGDQPPQPPQNRCPSDRACMREEECVPCPGQGQPGQPGFQSIPPGCRVEQGEFGQFIKCEEDKRYEEEKRRGEEDCKAHNGKFIIRPGTTAWECLPQTQGGFFNQGSCPSPEQLQQIESQCTSSQGRVEHFRDRNGCEVTSCRQEFSQGQGSEEERIKFMALSCEEQGGQFAFNERGPNCVGGQQQIRINRDLKPLDGVELLKVALEMENVIQTFNEIASKLEGLQNYYQEKGDEEKAQSFSVALSQLDGAINRLDEIRAGLAENADSFQEQDRFQVLEDLQQMNSIIKDVAVTLLTGGKSKRAATERFEKREFEAQPQQEGEDFMQAFKDCADFSKNSPFEFSPEPGTNVRLEGLDNGKCIMIVNPPDAPVEITFKLPSEVYQFFSGPQLLFRDDVECSPDFACKMMEQFIGQEQQSNTKRFGEEERNRGNQNQFQREQQPRPQQCDDAELNNEECVKWLYETQGSPPQCIGLNQEQCVKLLSKHWQQSPQNFNPPQQQFPQQPQQFSQPRQLQQGFQDYPQQNFQGREDFRKEFESQGFNELPSNYQSQPYQDFNQYPQQFNPPRQGNYQNYPQYQSYPQQQYPQQSFQEQPFQGNPSAGFCGDKTIAPSLGEECDDGNNQGGDGCSSTCKNEQQPVAIANVIKEFGNFMRGE